MLPFASEEAAGAETGAEAGAGATEGGGDEDDCDDSAALAEEANPVSGRQCGHKSREPGGPGGGDLKILPFAEPAAAAVGHHQHSPSTSGAPVLSVMESSAPRGGAKHFPHMKSCQLLLRRRGRSWQVDCSQLSAPYPSPSALPHSYAQRP